MRPRTRHKLANALRQLDADEAGVTSLEWTLLLAAIALPSYFIMRLALQTLVAHYGMLTTLNGLPLP
jgi:Flp pilus assembly pilin Flp